MSDAGASLYNRHRPSSFADLVGQEHVARALGNALRSGRPARAYLFSGPRGTGRPDRNALPSARATCSWPTRSAKLEGRWRL